MYVYIGIYTHAYTCVCMIPSVPPSLSFIHTEILLGASVLFLEIDKGNQMILK